MVGSIGSSDSSAMMSKMASRMFKKLDTNEDGGIDKTEMQAMIQNANGKGPSVDEIFKKTDTNNDGIINEEENSIAMENMRAEMDQMRATMQNRISGDVPPPPPEMLEDNESSEDSITALISKIADTLLEKLDSDGDKSVNKEELVSSLKDMLYQSSYSQNGSLGNNINMSGTLLNSVA